MDQADVERLFNAAAEIEPPTGLVNNAGLTAHTGDLADTPADVIRNVIDVNLVGVVMCAREAVRAMSTRRGGHGGAIVNISSAAATPGSPHESVHYAAAKAGVEELTVGLAKEVADDGIRVNAVAPGIVNTDIHAPPVLRTGRKARCHAFRCVGWPSPRRSRRRSSGCSAPRPLTPRAR